MENDFTNTNANDKFHGRVLVSSQFAVLKCSTGVYLQFVCYVLSWPFMFCYFEQKYSLQVIKLNWSESFKRKKIEFNDQLRVLHN